jgi:hypothetical protein
MMLLAAGKAPLAEDDTRALLSETKNDAGAGDGDDEIDFVAAMKKKRKEEKRRKKEVRMDKNHGLALRAGH